MWRASCNIYWMFDERTKTLYVRGHGNMPEFSLNDDERDADIPWNGLDFERVVIDYGITNVGTHSFLNCRHLKYAYLSDTVIRINDYAFEGCARLESVRLPERLILLGNSAFYGCRSLRGIRLPDRLKSIWDYAFFGCSGLKVVDIPDSIENIGSRAFYNCGSLTMVIDRNPRMDIEDDAFDENVHPINRKTEGWNHINPDE